MVVIDDALEMEDPHDVTMSVTREETVVLSASKRKVELVELDGNAAVERTPPGRELLLIPPYLARVSS